MNYKMIALDIDGTLLNDEHELTAATREAVRSAHEQGAIVVLCTGRGPINAIPVMERMGLEGMLIAHNGGTTVQIPGPKLIHQFAVPHAELVKLIDYCRSRDIHFDVNTAFEVYIDKAEPHIWDMYHRFLITPHLVSHVLDLTEPIVKFTMCATVNQIEQAVVELPQLGLSDEVGWIRSGDQFIDIMSVDAGKGKALAVLARSKGIAPEHILAIGNYHNDIDMLKFAGMGIAMGNSPDDVKAAADEVTATNNEEGVATALLKHMTAR